MAERVVTDGVIEDKDFKKEQKEAFEQQKKVALLLNKLQIAVSDVVAYRQLQDSIIAKTENREHFYSSELELRIEKIICEAVKRCKQDATSKKLLEEIFNSKEEIDNISVKEFIEGVGSFLKEKDKN